MSTIVDDEQLDRAMAEAELTGEERELVKQTLEDSDLSAEEAIGAVLATRGAEPEQPAAPRAEPLASEPTEKQLRELDRENERHVGKVRTIMGHFAEGLEECDKCGTMGLIEPGPEPQAHPFYIACPTCNAFGQVLTGSLVAEHTGVPCPDCAGRGYLEAMVDNTPATELIERMRATAPLIPAPAELPPHPDDRAPAAGQLTHGRPAWMGDPSVGG